MKTFDFPQYSIEWWSVRRAIPTASNFSRIITPKTGQPSKQMIEYVYELVAQRFDSDYGVVDDYVTAAMKNGTIMEPEARDFYCMERDVEVNQIGFCLSDDGRIGCSPDGLVGDDGGIELKSPMSKTQVKYLIKNECPPEYLPQVHGSLIVTGREWWDLLSYHPDFPPLLLRIEPDEYTNQLRSCLDEFLQMYAETLDRVQALGVDIPEADEVVMF